jgi:hypothetical protein
LSVGHRHRRSIVHDDELRRIAQTSWFQRGLAIERRLFRRGEIPWLGGSSTDSTRIYVDPRFAGKADYLNMRYTINVAMLMPALIEHEVVESILLLFGIDEKGRHYEYDGAHEIATAREIKVAQNILGKRGFRWNEESYQDIYKPFLKMTEKGPWQNLPPDLNTEPYREDAPEIYRELEKQILRGDMIVQVSKWDANYSKGNPQEHCGICSHYVKRTCEIVPGLIDPDYWCRYFEADNGGRHVIPRAMDKAQP